MSFFSAHGAVLPHSGILIQGYDSNGTSDIERHSFPDMEQVGGTSITSPLAQLGSSSKLLLYESSFSIRVRVRVRVIWSTDIHHERAICFGLLNPCLLSLSLLHKLVSSLNDNVLLAAAVVEAQVEDG
jgi:hypothetical protein